MAAAQELPPEEPIRGQAVLLPTPPPGGFTAADLPRLTEVVGARLELLDGHVVLTGPVTHWHSEAVSVLWRALRQVVPPLAVVATGKGIGVGHSVPVADVVVVARQAVTADSLVFQPSDVHLAIEVVSPGTKTRDRKFRPVQYAEAGSACLRRVENQDGAMVVYTFELLPEGGGYAPTGVFRGRVTVDRPFPVDIELPEVTW